MPGGTSQNPEARARALANLRRGNNPAPAGNQRRVTHGAYRAVLDSAELEAAERRVFDALAADAPVRAVDGELPPADAAAVRLLADVLVRLDGVSEYPRRRGLEDGKGRLRTTVLDLERRLRLEAADHAAALGMTPRSRAALGLDLARSFDLAAAWAEQDSSGQEGDVIDGDATDA
jgi:hypothetical protein